MRAPAFFFACCVVIAVLCGCTAVTASKTTIPATPLTKASKRMPLIPTHCDAAKDPACAARPGTGHYGNIGDISRLARQCGWYNESLDTVMWDRKACERLVVSLAWWAPFPGTALLVFLLFPVVFIVGRYVFDCCGGRLPTMAFLYPTAEDRARFMGYSPSSIRGNKIALGLAASVLFVFALISGRATFKVYRRARHGTFGPLSMETTFSAPFAVLDPVVAAPDPALVWSTVASLRATLKTGKASADAATVARAVHAEHDAVPAAVPGAAAMRKAERYALPPRNTRGLFTIPQRWFLAQIPPKIRRALTHADNFVTSLSRSVVALVVVAGVMSAFLVVGTILSIVFSVFNFGAGLVVVQALISWGGALTTVAALAILFIVQGSSVLCSVYDDTLIPFAVQYSTRHHMCQATLGEYGDKSLTRNQTAADIAKSVKQRLYEASTHRRSPTCRVLSFLCNDTARKKPSPFPTTAPIPAPIPASTATPSAAPTAAPTTSPTSRGLLELRGLDAQVLRRSKEPKSVAALVRALPKALEGTFTCPKNPCARPRRRSEWRASDVGTAMEKSTLQLGAEATGTSILQVAVGNVTTADLMAMIAASTNETVTEQQMEYLVTAANIPRFTSRLAPLLPAIVEVATEDRSCKVARKYLEAVIRPRVCNSEFTGSAYLSFGMDIIVACLAWPVMILAIRGIKRFRSAACCPLPLAPNELRADKGPDADDDTEGTTEAETASTRGATTVDLDRQPLVHAAPPALHRPGPRRGGGGGGGGGGAASRAALDDDLDTLGSGQEMQTLLRPSLQSEAPADDDLSIASRQPSAGSGASVSRHACGVCGACAGHRQSYLTTQDDFSVCQTFTAGGGLGVDSAPTVPLAAPAHRRPGLGAHSEPTLLRPLPQGLAGAAAPLPAVLSAGRYAAGHALPECQPAASFSVASCAPHSCKGCDSARFGMKTAAPLPARPDAQAAEYLVDVLSRRPSSALAQCSTGAHESGSQRVPWSNPHGAVSGASSNPLRGHVAAPALPMTAPSATTFSDLSFNPAAAARSLSADPRSIGSPPASSSTPSSPHTGPAPFRSLSWEASGAASPLGHLSVTGSVGTHDGRSAATPKYAARWALAMRHRRGARRADGRASKPSLGTGRLQPTRSSTSFRNGSAALTDRSQRRASKLSLSTSPRPSLAQRSASVVSVRPSRLARAFLAAVSTGQLSRASAISGRLSHVSSTSAFAPPRCPSSRPSAWRWADLHGSEETSPVCPAPRRGESSLVPPAVAPELIAADRPCPQPGTSPELPDRTVQDDPTALPQNTTQPPVAVPFFPAVAVGRMPPVPAVRIGALPCPGTVQVGLPQAPAPWPAMAPFAPQPHTKVPPASVVSAAPPRPSYRR